MTDQQTATNEIKITSKIETSIYETQNDFIVESIVSLMGVTESTSRRYISKEIIEKALYYFETEHKEEWCILVGKMLQRQEAAEHDKDD